MPVANMEFFQINIFVLLNKICKILGLLKIQGTGCYNIDVTLISSLKDGLLKFVKIQISARY